MKARRAGAVAAILGSLAAAPRPAAPAPLPARAAGLEDALWSRLRRIESAFRAGDAASLRACFPAASKLRVDLPEVPGGPASYGPGQLQVIFARVFASASTREFEFIRNEVTRPSSGTAFARGRWVRGPTTGQPEQSGAVTFTLRQDGGDWLIHEIFATP
jgi:Domain of unknown function (DUF4440)